MRLRGRFKKKEERLNDLEKLTIKPFGEMYFHFEERLRDELKARTDSELMRILDVVDKISDKDWYALFRVKESLKELVCEVLSKRDV